MTRTAIAGVLLVAVLGGFFYAATHVVAGETWPDW